METSNEERLVYSTEFWDVLLMDEQTYLGRSVVVLKRKCGDLAEVSHDEMIDFMDNVVKKLEEAYRSAFNATMFNWTCLMNLAYREEVPDPQVHWHFRPRYKNSVEFNGTTFTDPNFGSHYDEKAKMMIDDAMRSKIIQKVRDSLE